jgi:hypothetical protein
MTSRTRKILLGILIAIGCLAAVVVVLVVSFFMWLSQPGEVIAVERLLSAESTGYAQWTLRTEDPGTEGFLRLLVQSTQELPTDLSGSVPPAVDGWLRSARAEGAAGDLAGFLPGVAAWTLRPASEDDRHLHLVSVSATGLGNQLVFADWIGGWTLPMSPNGSVDAYKGENIYQFAVPRRDVELTFFARRGAVFATSDLATARQAVDLLAAEEATPQRPATDLERLFATTQGPEPLRAAITNARGELPHVWSRLGGGPAVEPEEWQTLRGVTVTGGLRADGTFTGVLDLLTVDGRPREDIAPRIAAAIQQRLSDLDLDADVQATGLEDRIRIELRVLRLVESITERTQGGRR